MADGGGFIRDVIAAIFHRVLDLGYEIVRNSRPPERAPLGDQRAPGAGISAGETASEDGPWWLFFAFK
jgi:hypothetical protein